MIGLILFNAGCVTRYELIHVPIDCVGQPDVSLGFTQEEADRFTDSMDTKLSIFAITLRERIDTQCRLNKLHDKLHEVK